MSIPASKRTADQVTTLWTSAFNTHDIKVLKECYSETVVSQQLVDTQLTGRDSVLATYVLYVVTIVQCLLWPQNMFELWLKFLEVSM